MNPFAGVNPADVARIVTGHGDDLARLGWISADENEPPDFGLKSRPGGVVVVSWINARLGTGVLWAPDLKIANWHTTVLFHHAPQARVVPVSTSSRRRYERLLAYHLAERPKTTVPIAKDFLPNAYKEGMALYPRSPEERRMAATQFRRAVRRAAPGV